MQPTDSDGHRRFQNCVAAVKESIEKYLEGHHLSHIFVPNGVWVARAGETVVMAISMEIQAAGFREAVRDLVR